MKLQLLFKVFVLGLCLMPFASCNNDNSANSTNSDSTRVQSETQTTTTTTTESHYINLKTGKPVQIQVDTVHHVMIDYVSNEPVEFYVDTLTWDTLYGLSPEPVVVNTALSRTSDGVYKLDETKIKRDGDRIKLKYPDGTKVKMDKDGMKIKDDTSKLKMNDKGEVKEKH